MAGQISLEFRSGQPIDPALSAFHPLVQEWFAETLGDATEPQRRGWPLLLAGEDMLLAAPTGSGKTLTAFLASLDRLFRLALEGKLPDHTQILYVSPLKALGNDVQKNLLWPLEALEAKARARGHLPQAIRVHVRTGDTSMSERAKMLRRPPHILITTPESLYLYLTAAKGRETLRTVRTVIVDEIHALAKDRRGSHLALSMERLKALCRVQPQLIGLSATQKPMERIAGFLGGGDAPRIQLVQVGHLRPWDVRVEMPDDALGAVASKEMWAQIHDRLVALSEQYRTTLVFVNTRKMAERLAHDLSKQLGEDKVRAHHGSMARELRLDAEEKLKAGQLRIMVATASLELGIDIGDVDLVCQMGTPRSIATALQRVGRAGHHKAGISRGIFFAQTRDELLECTALLRAIKSGELDVTEIPEKPLDVLAQQIVAACAAEEWDERALFALFRRAYPYRSLTWEEFDKVLHTLSEGDAPNRGRARVHLHRDRVNQRLRPRKGARTVALSNGGAIPDTFTYPVIAEPEGKTVGTLDEDFAIESMAGDIFLLGSTAWRIQRVGSGAVFVENAQGQPPSVPFWRGEAPGRTNALSLEVSKLREELVRQEHPAAWLQSELGLSPMASDALVAYVRAGERALGAVPTQTTVIAERFFDESGGMQLLIHAPFGSRINRAWGLGLRKKFCRTFDFELQAAATDDGLLLSLGEQHSFPLEDIFGFLHPDRLEEVLTQAVLQTPLFPTRFRWTASRALALIRYYNGKRVPPQLQRSRSEDLMASVFPAGVGCQDNHGGADVELPDHPLVSQAMNDCLHEALDIEGLRAVLRDLKDGKIRTLACDVPEPSVFAHHRLKSQPYTWLDDAPLEERRARAVSLRRTLSPEDAVAFGSLDASAIAQVVEEARPLTRDPDELHDVLLQQIVLPKAEVPAGMMTALVRDGRATWLVPADLSAGVNVPPSPADVGSADAAGAQGFDSGAALPDSQAVDAAEIALAQHIVRVARPVSHSSDAAERAIAQREPRRFAVATERLLSAAALYPHAPLTPPLAPLPDAKPTTRDDALLAAIRGHMETAGPLTAMELAARFGFGEAEVLSTLTRLESEGQVLRGNYRPRAPGGDAPVLEWCDRRLLQRIHRLTVGRLRKEIEPLSAQDFMRFLFRWHHIAGDDMTDSADSLRGVGGVIRAAALLEGFEAPASEWESSLLAVRMKGYQPEWLEQACWNGELAFGRLTVRDEEAPAEGAEPRRPSLTRSASLTFTRRAQLDPLLWIARGTAQTIDPQKLSPAARDVAQALSRRGALFFPELVTASKRLAAEVEDALWELVGRGVVSADAVQNLRVLQSPARRKRQRQLQRGGPGRWSLLRPLEEACTDTRDVQLEKLVRLFLDRYGIVFRELVMREALAPSWRELLFVLRRMEARGDVRGGRFLSGSVGEQYALPQAVELARQIRRQPPTKRRVVIAAVDPLNLTGIVTPGPRVAAIPGRRVTYVDGIPQNEVVDVPELLEDDAEVEEALSAPAPAEKRALA